MKKNKDFKAINRKAMKTRILTIALMIAFTTGVVAATTQDKVEDTLFSSHIALVSGSVSSESDGINVFNTNSTELYPSGVSIQNTVNLEEWVANQDSWEQESSELSATSALGSVDLEGWVESRESWEQESSETTQTGVENSSSLLEEWVSDRETWESAAYETDLSPSATVIMQEEWFTSRETWEQK
jgi:hypothetical protein